MFILQVALRPLLGLTSEVRRKKGEYQLFTQDGLGRGLIDTVIAAQAWGPGFDPQHPHKQPSMTVFPSAGEVEHDDQPV